MKSMLKIALAVSVSGCYVYVPSDAVPSPGQEVRAHLSPAQDFDLGTITVRDVTRVDGVIFGATPDTVEVWSSWLHSLAGARFHSGQAMYSFSRDRLSTVEVRRLHPFRTIVGAGVTVGVMYSMLNFVADVGGGEPGEGLKGNLEQQVARPFSR